MEFARMNSTYKCRGCKIFFRRPAITINGGNFHTIECATQYGSKKSAKLKVKQEKKSHSAAKRKLKDEDRGFQTKKTQTIFNKYIRLRDGDDPCISCNRHHTGRYDAGHYLSAGAYPALRFHPLNCHKQCHYNCNINRSGNIAEYRIHLVKKIGLHNLEWLEGPHEAKRYTIENLKTLQRWFKRKSRRLEQ